MTATTAAAAPVAGAAIDKPWLQSYPPGVPATIEEANLTTLAQMFRDSVRDFAERPAVESFGKRMTYAELGKAADAVASWLQGQGLKAGDRVAIMLPNVMAYPAILHGVLTAGYTVVNVNPLYTPRELIHQLKDAGARVLFVLENFGHTVEEALPELKLDKVVLATPGDLMGLKGAIVNLVSRHVKKAVKPYNLPAAIPFKTVLAEGRKSPAKPADVGLEDVAFLQYTGGTTGVAKGATLTHRNVAANVVQMDLWMKSCLGERPDHVMVTALPLYHIFALTVCAMLMGRLGACQLLIANPRDIPGFVKILKGSKFTLMSGVNTLYNALANSPDIKAVDFSNVVLCVSGAMATQAAVARKWKELSGCPIVGATGSPRPRRWSAPTGSTSRSSPARSAIPCPRPTCRSATPTARSCRRASPGSFASRARRSCAATGTSPRRPRRSRPPTAISAPATSRCSCPTARSRSSTA